jgi:non-ribosomal peptide synthetase component F
VAESDQASERAARSDEVVQQAKQTFEQALDRIKPTAVALANALRELNNPSSIEVEFAIKFTSGAGVVFASTAVEGNFAVKLTWNNEPVEASRL